MIHFRDGRTPPTTWEKPDGAWGVMGCMVLSKGKGTCDKNRGQDDKRWLNKKLLGAPGIATNGAIGRYVRGC